MAAFDPDITLLDRFVEQRQGHRFVADSVEALPIDVEIARVTRALPAPQDVVPPGVLDRRRHVVGHEVDDDSQPVCARDVAESREPGFAAQFRIEAIAIDDVVAMRAAGSRRGDRGQVKMGNAQLGQVGNDIGSGSEIELLTQLQPVGGDGDHSSRQITCHAASVPCFGSPQITAPISVVS